jgi:hypothetical protein
MKYFLIVLLALCISGCTTKYQHVEFNGAAKGVKNGVFIIKDYKKNAIYGVNIKDGKFHIESKVLEVPGYYMMDITDDASPQDQHKPFEIYLEDGKYTIEAEAGKLANYPKVTAPSSTTQQQLNSFYTAADQMNGDLNQELAELYAKVNSKATNALPKDQFNALLNSVSELEGKKYGIVEKAFDKYVTDNPQNTIGAHIMLRQDYESDPVFYNQIYQKLTPAVKATEDGKEIGDKLSKLVKLVPGHEAPAIEGKLISGKAFDPKGMHKKIFLIDFWRAGNQVARINHAEIKTMLKDFGKSGFEVISVSMDTKKDWWTTAVNEDKITWTQVSDLKGDDSPNTQNWSVARLPRYDLVDGNWQMIERDVSFGQVYLDVEQYLKKHP